MVDIFVPKSTFFSRIKFLPNLFHVMRDGPRMWPIGGTELPILGVGAQRLAGVSFGGSSCSYSDPAYADNIPVSGRVLIVFVEFLIV